MIRMMLALTLAAIAAGPAEPNPPKPSRRQLWVSQLKVIKDKDSNTLTLTVDAVAPSPGYKDIELVPRATPSADHYLEFDCYGRVYTGRSVPIQSPITHTVTKKIPAPNDKDEIAGIRVWGDEKNQAPLHRDGKLLIVRKRTVVEFQFPTPPKN
jgi:hypothetical protein